MTVHGDMEAATLVVSSRLGKVLISPNQFNAVDGRNLEWA